MSKGKTMKSDLTSLLDLSKAELEHLFDLTDQLKADKAKYAQTLKGKSVALLFQKPSNRTRVSFEIGIYQLGGKCLYLSPREIKLGQRESVADVAKTLSRYLDALVARTNTHHDILELAKNATIPVINGLSDLYHPCQALADIYSIREKFKTFQGITVAYIGDGNNVCHSLLIGCAKVGLHLNIATPKGYEPNKKIVTQAKDLAKQTGARFIFTNKPQEAVKEAHVIYTDVWTSMGQEREAKKRIKAFKGFQINKNLVKGADKKYIFMHCLPAHRNEEVTDEIIDGTHSIVFDQAENRMHTQKAILIFLLGE